MSTPFTENTQFTGNTQITGQKLRRSRRDRVFLGVCGGLAEYFAIDPVIVRLAFVLITLAGGAGVLAYIIMSFVMPDGEPLPTDGTAGPFLTEGTPQPATGAGQHASVVGALVLIGIGLVFLVDNLRWFGWFRPDYVWPLILIGLGVALLARRTNAAN